MSHSPLEIEVVLHYYHSPEPHPRVNAPAVKEAIQRFVNDGILSAAEGPALLKVTDRGNAWVRMIVETPYPEGAWIDPRTREIF
jgi:hypothetical protein